MTCRVEVILYYDKPNRGSLNSLCGAFEAAGLCETASLHLVRDREEFVARVMGRTDAPTLACISFATPQYWATRDLVAALAGRPAGTILVAGGPHPTAMPAPTRAMGFDVVVVGAGEQAFVDLVRGMSGGGGGGGGKAIGRIGPIGPIGRIGPAAWEDNNRPGDGSAGASVAEASHGQLGAEPTAEASHGQLGAEPTAEASHGQSAPVVLTGAPLPPAGAAHPVDASARPPAPGPMSPIRPIGPIRPIRPMSFPFPSVSPAIGAVGPVEITRGCPFRCGYCQTPRIFPGPVQHRSVDSIARQLAAQRAERLNDFRFVAPNAFGYGATPGRTDPAAVEALLTEAKAAVKGGRLFFGTFPSEVRPESVSPEMLELVRKFAHNDNLTLGLQTGSERLLSTIGRGHTVAQVVAAVELANRAGFAVNVDVIFGMPDETEEDVSETLCVMRELIGLGARIHAHSYMPLPGTPWWPRPPAPTPPTLDAVLNRLIPTGQLFGHWQAQRKLATRILQEFAGPGNR